VLEGVGSCVHSSPYNSRYVEGYSEILLVGFDENQNSTPTLFKGQVGVNPSLGGTTRNHLKEWLKNQKQPNHFLGPFSLNVFTIIIFFSCLSIACTNICLQFYFENFKIYIPN